MPLLRGETHPEARVAFRENPLGYRSRFGVLKDFIYLSHISKRNTLYENIPSFYFDQALKVYSRAGRSELGFLVLGRKTIDGVKPSFSTESISIIDSAIIKNLGPLNEARGKVGSVLHSDSWSFYLNDMFMAGGINNREPFYLASKRTMSNLWENNHPTIFARELTGLFGAGYELQVLQDGSEVMAPPCDVESKSLSLLKYRSIRDKLLTSDQLGFIGHTNIKSMVKTRGNYIPQFRTSPTRFKGK